MEAQKYEELDKLCKEMEKVITRAIEETIQRTCKLKVYYFFSHDEFSFEVDVPYYNATLSTGCCIPAMLFRNVSQDEFMDICVDYAGTIATALEDSIRRYGNEKDKA